MFKPRSKARVLHADSTQTASAAQKAAVASPSAAAAPAASASDAPPAAPATATDGSAAAQLPIQLSAMRKAAISPFKGVVYVSIREYYEVWLLHSVMAHVTGACHAKSDSQNGKSLLSV